MTAPTLECWARWWQGRGAPDLISTEVVGPHGIADVVAVRFDTHALRAREEAGIDPVNDFGALRVLLACRRTARSTEDLARLLGLSESSVRRALQVCNDSGALEKVGSRRYVAHPAWRPAARRLVAVELKRSDWQRATRQLWAYQVWASAAWLVLGRRPPISAIEGLKAMGIGLGYLGEDGGAQIVLRPRAKRLSGTVASAWAGEQLLDRTGPSCDPCSSALRSGSPRLEGVPALLGG
jgi:hypothetical protein